MLKNMMTSFLVNQLTKVYDRESHLIDVISKKAPQKVHALFKNLKLQVDSATANVSKMGTFDGKTELRDAALRVFNAYKDAFADDYIELIKIAKIPDSLYSPDDDDKKIDLCKKIDKKINKANNDFKELEKGFISKYKIEIIPEVKEQEKGKK